MMTYGVFVFLILILALGCVVAFSGAKGKCKENRSDAGPRGRREGRACPHCGYANNDRAQYCGHCGRQLDDHGGSL